MPQHYKLVPSGQPDSAADEIILTRDELGEPEHGLSIHRARELPEKLLDEAHKLANQLGFRVVEAPPPDDEEEARQPVGADTAGQVSVGGGASSGGPIEGGTSATAGAGTPGSSATTTPPTTPDTGTV